MQTQLLQMLSRRNGVDAALPGRKQTGKGEDFAALLTSIVNGTVRGNVTVVDGGGNASPASLMISGGTDTERKEAAGLAAAMRSIVAAAPEQASAEEGEATTFHAVMRVTGEDGEDVEVPVLVTVVPATAAVDADTMAQANSDAADGDGALSDAVPTVIVTMPDTAGKQGDSARIVVERELATLRGDQPPAVTQKAAPVDRNAVTGGIATEPDTPPMALRGSDTSSEPIGAATHTTAETSGGVTETVAGETAQHTVSIRSSATPTDISNDSPHATKHTTIEKTAAVKTVPAPESATGDAARKPLPVEGLTAAAGERVEMRPADTMAGETAHRTETAGSAENTAGDVAEGTVSKIAAEVRIDSADSESPTIRIVPARNTAVEKPVAFTISVSSESAESDAMMRVFEALAFEGVPVDAVFVTAETDAETSVTNGDADMGSPRIVAAAAETHAEDVTFAPEKGTRSDAKTLESLTIDTAHIPSGTEKSTASNAAVPEEPVVRMAVAGNERIPHIRTIGEDTVMTDVEQSAKNTGTERTAMNANTVGDSAETGAVTTIADDEVVVSGGEKGADTVFVTTESEADKFASGMTKREMSTDMKLQASIRKAALEPMAVEGGPETVRSDAGEGAKAAVTNTTPVSDERADAAAVHDAVDTNVAERRMSGMTANSGESERAGTGNVSQTEIGARARTGRESSVVTDELSTASPVTEMKVDENDTVLKSAGKATKPSVASLDTERETAARLPSDTAEKAPADILSKTELRPESEVGERVTQVSGDDTGVRLERAGNTYRRITVKPLETPPETTRTERSAEQVSTSSALLDVSEAAGSVTGNSGAESVKVPREVEKAAQTTVSGRVNDTQITDSRRAESETVHSTEKNTVWHDASGAAGRESAADGVDTERVEKAVASKVPNEPVDMHNDGTATTEKSLSEGGASARRTDDATEYEMTANKTVVTHENVKKAEDNTVETTASATVDTHAKHGKHTRLSPAEQAEARNGSASDDGYTGVTAAASDTMSGDAGADNAFMWNHDGAEKDSRLLHRESSGMRTEAETVFSLGATETPQTLSTAGDVAESVDVPANAADIENKAMESIVHNASMMVKNGQSSAVIKLEPPSLGKLKLEIVTERSKVTGKITVETHEARQIVENRMTELKMALDQHGLKVESFDVQVGHNDGTDAWANRENAERQANANGGLPHPGLHMSSDEPQDVRTLRTPYRPSNSGGLDIWI